ncbi:carbohydrate ABC transporter substrate-binding protein [Eubacterium sp. am_0171]|uniref:Putative ABC transporter substrate-binding protein yesO n=1 Tax=Faecalicatena contorta TaxID=39482 RepID=A0A174J804_9FIRM|nr:MULTISPECIES: ABC transporter substrate-binding protein [Clostridia]MDU7707012.1 ABC transporter substrate-binding protein [Clostridium sp.]MSC83773.1 extracellular solute-binding protein [Eubacterium sp. BIOML-A1]MSD06101.1 extracellular solute-binding protein [Eubacterium sp. BIOML-A2]RYT22235.1 carbohydrate ABC transporter substrate-binding protein [Eubacterium sp. am_0171]CUO93325.1 Putative ABC transporter substrate-binding protein yesO [[Eubacterium] contortum] [Faecalicatena contorta
MKKRKLLSVMLCIMLLVMGICACGKSEVQKDSSDSSSGDDEKIELTFMGWQPELQIMNEKMLPLLEEKYPNIHIKVEVLEWFDYWDKLTIDSVAGDSADIVAMDVDHIPTFQDYYMGLDDLAGDVLGEDWESAYNNGVLDDLRSVSSDKSLKMMPSDITGLWYIFYNKTMCDELGVAVPNGEYEDLARFAKEIKEKDPSALPVAFAAKEDVNLGFFYLWLATNNEYGIVQDAVEGKASFEDEAFVKAFEQLKKMYDDGILAEENFGLDAYPGCDEAFKNGNCAAYLTGEWYLGNYLMGTALKGTPTENDEFGVVTMQNVEGGETCMQKYASFGYSISNECEYKEEAMKVLEEWTQGAAAGEWLNYMACVPAAKDVTIDMENMQSDEAKATYQKAFDDLNTNPAVLRSTLNTELDNKIGEVVVSVMRSGLSVDDALSQIQQTAESVR